MMILKAQANLYLYIKKRLVNNTSNTTSFNLTLAQTPPYYSAPLLCIEALRSYNARAYSPTFANKPYT